MEGINIPLALLVHREEGCILIVMYVVVEGGITVGAKGGSLLHMHVISISLIHAVTIVNWSV